MRLMPLALGVAALILAGGCDRPLASPTKPASAARPTRIVSQTVLADELLWQLGPDVRQRVIGVSALADDLRYSHVAGRWPSALPRLGGGSEAVLAVNPQVVMVANFTSQELRSLLRSAGVTVVMLDNLTGFAALRESITKVAQAVDAQRAGAEAIARFDAELARLQKLRPSNETTGMSWVDGIIAGRATTIDDVFAAAGVRNVASSAGISGHARARIEQVIIWNPYWVFVPCRGDDCGEAVSAYCQIAALAGTAACAQGRVRGIPERLLLTSGFGMLDLVARVQSETAPPSMNQP